MVQNRNKLISLFIGNTANIVVHRLLEKAIDDETIVNKYIKEEIISLNIAKKYREKINPVKGVLPKKDSKYIKKRLMNTVKSELLSRISRGYENIDLEMVEESVDKVLREMSVE